MLGPGEGGGAVGSGWADTRGRLIVNLYDDLLLSIFGRH